MKLDVVAVRKRLKAFDFSNLFREHVGWDRYSASLPITVDGTTFNLTAVAEKKGFQAFVCPSIPDRQVRIKIDRQVAKSAREHFIIYTDQAAGQQVWQWVRQQKGKPAANREQRFNTSQSGDSLIQALEQLAVSLQEEESATLVGVAGQVAAAFDVDRVTKRFYDQFKTEHTAFQKFIKGIQEQGDLEWYTSLMLNRLMFVYFIQKKGFLDGDTDYLRNRLEQVQKLRGKDKFQSFYRFFLLRLFHQGLGQAADERKLDSDMAKLLGKVPYLNGGFFEVHQLEERNANIDIPDRAFEKLFDFFDQYSWHLDERELRAGNEINPDVVGYIFEKYINQKQMGAYYTKEDITEYISKNTIIPFLFDAAAKKCPIAFQKGSFIWRLLSDAPDRYIYAAVRHGVVDEEGRVIPLPKDIEKGVKDVAKREGWNKAAPAPFALPTETWREHVSRRTRCLELRQKLKNGEVASVNDLVTLNLHLWQFAGDAIVNAEGPEVLRAFWDGIEHVTVLDPTCGSGAFLFAALRILETLYSDCLEGMKRFVADHAARPHHPEQFTDFRKVLGQVDKHPNEKYFVLKSIIIGNLFGVDIMEEAVEICKLRLFLKLVAQVDEVGQIEPLPDIDFNIKAGNTLVGYATKQKARQAFSVNASGQGKLALGDAEEAYKRFDEDAESVDRSFRQFRLQQTTHGGKVTFGDKQALRKQLAKLDDELDRFLAVEHGISPEKKTAFETWRSTHQPFHWFVEFYGIMDGGGFDVIVGNPPYVEYRKVRNHYKVDETSYETATAQNLYAFCTERSSILLSQEGRFGMIIPSSAVGLDETACLRKLMTSRYAALWCSTYSIRPAKLFEGVDQRLCIMIGSSRSADGGLFTTCYNHWLSEARPALFPTLGYTRSLVHPRLNRIAQLGGSLDRGVLARIEHRAARESGAYFASLTKGYLAHYHRSPRYWIRAMDFEPHFKSETKSRSVHHFRDLLFQNEADGKCVCAIINSSLFFFWFMAICNGRNLTSVDVGRFPVGVFDPSIRKQLVPVFDRLMKDYRQHSFVRERADCEYQEFRPSLSKLIIDEVDTILAEHYGFTDEELDFVINYDIKYRMGAEEDSEGE